MYGSSMTHSREIGIAIIAIVATSIVFMLRFLFALLEEESRMIRARNATEHRMRNFTALSSTPYGFTDHLTTHGLEITNEVASRRYPVSCLAVVSSPRSQVGTIRLRWLITGALLLLTLPIAAQSADPQNSQSTTAQPTASSANPNQAQNSSSAPLPTPTITGPLQAAPPIQFDAGPLGKLDVNGILSGTGLWQGNHVPGDNPTQAALSNGQVFVQKASGWWQFYVQAGAYDILALGSPFLSTDKAISDLYGPVPVAYLKLAP